MRKLESRAHPSFTDNQEIRLEVLGRLKVSSMICIEAISIIKDRICDLPFYKVLVFFMESWRSHPCKRPVTECTVLDKIIQTSSIEIEEIIRTFLNSFWAYYSDIYYENNYKHEKAGDVRDNYILLAVFGQSVVWEASYTLAASRLAEGLTGVSLSLDSEMFGYLMHTYTWVVERKEILRIIQCLDETKTFPTLWTYKEIESVLAEPQFAFLYGATYADVESVCAQILTELKEECTLSNVSDDGCCPICKNNLLQVVGVPKCQHLFCHTCIKKLDACHLCRGDIKDHEMRNVKNLRTTEVHEIQALYEDNGNI